MSVRPRGHAGASRPSTTSYSLARKRIDRPRDFAAKGNYHADDVPAFKPDVALRTLRFDFERGNSDDGRAADR